MLENYREIEDVNTLQESLPYKPYCTDSLERGLQIRPRRTALQKKYLSLNPPHMKVFVTFDLDYPVYDPEFIEKDCNLPLPTWCVVNPANKHAHVIYVLNKPVFTTSIAHVKPLNYLQAIIDAYSVELDADPNYSGLVSKNPWCNFWQVIQVSKCAYDLAYLADYVSNELKDKVKKRPSEERMALGRNCCVFEKVRVWSYRAIRKFWSGKHGSLTCWMEEVLHRCLQENAKFTEPMDEREVRGIAKSISHWTWRHLTPEGFSTIQRRKANHRWAKESVREIGLELLKEGLSTLEVSQELGVSQRTCQIWSKLLGMKREIILPEEYRGADGKQRLAEQEGISRATYYRRQQEEGEHVPPLSESKPWETMGISRGWYYELKKRGNI